MKLIRPFQNRPLMAMPFVSIDHKSRARSFYIFRKTSCLFLLILLTTTGCMKYQYISLDSTLTDGPNQYLTYQSDTVIINYLVVENELSLGIEIYNISEDTIYIDWTKSVLLFNNKRYSFVEKNDRVVAIMEKRSSSSNPNFQYNKNMIDEDVFQGDQISELFPEERMTVQPIQIVDNFINLERNSYSRKVKMNEIGDRGKEHNFHYASSPLVFKSYFTLATDEKFENQVIVNDEFWVSQVLVSGTNPSAFTYRRYNQPYISKTTDGSEFVYGVTLTGLFAGLVYLAAQECYDCY